MVPFSLISFISLMMTSLLLGAVLLGVRTVVVMLLRIRTVIALAIVSVTRRVVVVVLPKNLSTPKLPLIPSIVIVRVVALIIKVCTIPHTTTIVSPVRAPVTMGVYDNAVRYVVIK
jgi:hypothetical protein